MAHPQQGDTRVGDDGVHWVFDGGIWRGEHVMYQRCPVLRKPDGTRYQYFPAAPYILRQRNYGIHYDKNESEDDST